MPKRQPKRHDSSLFSVYNIEYPVGTEYTDLWFSPEAQGIL